MTIPEECQMIPNELLFIGVMLSGLGIALAAGYMGRIWLQMFIVAITLMLGVTDAKIVMAFGLPITLGTALYSAIFFATDMLTERYGKQAGYQAIRLSFFAMLIFQLFVQITRIAAPAPEVEELSAAMDLVYGTSLRMVGAGIIVYAISQHFDVWLYHEIHQWTGGKHLWLRNNGSTVASQALDTYLFCFLAFYGVIDEWYWIATVGYGVKLVVAMSDTAFMYASKLFVPLDLRTQTPK